MVPCIMTVSVMTVCIMTINITTISIISHCITTISLKATFGHSVEHLNYTECHLFAAAHSVIILSVVMMIVEAPTFLPVSNKQDDEI
jgi:hypothetical protein